MKKNKDTNTVLKEIVDSEGLINDLLNQATKNNKRLVMQEQPLVTDAITVNHEALKKSASLIKQVHINDAKYRRVEISTDIIKRSEELKDSMDLLYKTMPPSRFLMDEKSEVLKTIAENNKQSIEDQNLFQIFPDLDKAIEAVSDSELKFEPRGFLVTGEPTILTFDMVEKVSEDSVDSFTDKECIVELPSKNEVVVNLPTFNQMVKFGDSFKEKICASDAIMTTEIVKAVCKEADRSWNKIKKTIKNLNRKITIIVAGANSGGAVITSNHILEILLDPDNYFYFTRKVLRSKFLNKVVMENGYPIYIFKIKIYDKHELNIDKTLSNFSDIFVQWYCTVCIEADEDFMDIDLVSDLATKLIDDEWCKPLY